VDEFEALVLREVGVVLEVERGERKLSGDAAGGDPGVVDRAWASRGPGIGLDLASDRATRKLPGRTTTLAKQA
jgi:hypothetical protein